MSEKTKITQPKSLREALNLFQKQGIAAKKDQNNPFHKSKYASLQEVIQAVNEAAQFGLSFTQKIDYTTSATEHGTFTDMWIETIISFNGSEEKLVSKYPIIPQKNMFDDSKQLGSAITYAKRYALQSIYGIPSEDDDGNKNFYQKGTPYKTTSKQKQGKMTPNTQDVLNRIDESNKPVYTLQLPGNQKKDHDSLNSLGLTLNDLVLHIMSDPETDKTDKLKKIKQAYTVNSKVIEQLSRHDAELLDEIEKKIKRFENA
tara:strand:+ start:6184 stop:6960 length:777 start_codon:yes stop_codon:yes gene_type:complete